MWTKIQKIPRIASSEITPEGIYMNRRRFITLASGVTIAASSVNGWGQLKKGPYDTDEKQTPYKDVGLRMDEAMNPLTILAVGLYGKQPLPNQNGAPLRLVVPWKYGFKGIKSIAKIRFVEKQPLTAWMKQAPNEYGFYANVNPAVDHPRWSQANERRLGEFFKRKTLPFNGYGDQVAAMYTGMDLRKNF
jgi:hypothetical protein